MPVTFDVSPVELATRPLPRQAFKLGFERLLSTSVEACGGSVPELVDGVAGHAFLAAVHQAFAWHHPLVLRPDDIWLLLAQGLALHVNGHAEELRERFVDHQGQATITVRRDDFVPGSPSNPWPEAFGAFSDEVARVIGRKRDLIVADFSTTGPAERAASEVVLLDAMRPYFRQRLYTMCGVPRVTLFGTVEDWRSIQERARMFGEFGLEAWVRALEPVLEQLVSASRGQPDPSFWRSFYKHDAMSGGPYVTGWVNVFFPFLRADEQGELAPNPHALAWSPDAGARSDDFPSGVSRAPFEWRVLDRTLAMELLGGFAGVSQDPDTLAVRPEIGWAVRPVTPGGPIEPQLDPATGQKVHHVLFVGPPGPALDALVEEVRRSAAGRLAADGASFDVPAGEVVLRVHGGLPIGVVPSGVVLVVTGRDGGGPEHAKTVAALERSLLESGRLRDLPLRCVWDGRTAPPFEALPSTFRAVLHHVFDFAPLEPGAGKRAFDDIRERLAP